MLLLYSEVTMPLYFKSLITMNRQAPRHNACDPGPNCLHPGTQWAKMAQPAIDPTGIPTSYLATFVACVFNEDCTSVTKTSCVTQPMRSLVSSIPPSLSTLYRGTPGPTCQPSSKLPGLLAQNQLKGRRMRWKMQFRSIPKLLHKIFKFSCKLQWPCVP